jgi:hypothetical protein
MVADAARLKEACAFGQHIHRVILHELGAAMLTVLNETAELDRDAVVPIDEVNSPAVPFQELRLLRESHLDLQLSGSGVVDDLGARRHTRDDMFAGDSPFLLPREPHDASA